MGCLKLNTHTHLKVVHTSNTERSGEDKSCTGLYKYRFNGQEYQDELGLNITAMDWRQYDGAIGRFNCIDPVTHFSQSTYNAFDSNPVSIADPSGADGVTPEPINTWHYAGGNQMNTGAGHLSAGDHMFGGSGDDFWNGQTAFTGGDLAWGNYYDDIRRSTISVGNIQYLGSSEDCCGDTVALRYGGGIIAGLLVDDATVIGVIDDVLIPAVVLGTAVAYLWDNKALAAKQAVEIARIIEKAMMPSGFTYQLVVNNSGKYLDVRGNSIFLNAGSVWKYGETTGSRYSDLKLQTMIPGGVRMVPLFYGNQTEIKVQEKIMIYSYAMMNGSLPPGNKIFR
jgi:RHS repeat-associated protein